MADLRKLRVGMVGGGGPGNFFGGPHRAHTLSSNRLRSHVAQAETVRSLNPPWCSYDAPRTASTSRAACGPSGTDAASACRARSSASIPAIPSEERPIVPGRAHARQTAPPASGR